MQVNILYGTNLPKENNIEFSFLKYAELNELYFHCTLYPMQDDMKYVFSTATLILVVDSSYSIWGLNSH